MNIKLLSISIQSFKGLKSFKFSPDGGNATITAQNGTGKTTVYDAFLWLLFGKDSLGRKDYKIRPLDADNQPINGLTLAVEAVLSIDGATHTFRKEQVEKFIKEKMTGFETLCYIDEVPKKVGEYNDYIAEIVSEETFKALTDLAYFNNLHHTKRRILLLEFAGKIGSPAGFEELLNKLNGRSIDDYKKVLAGQQTRLKKDRDEINPRIDEIQRGLADYAEADTTDLDRQRKDITAKITKIDGMRQGVFAQEQERQKKIDAKNTLQTKKIRREGELQNDTSGITDLLNEKAEIETRVARLKQIVADTEISILTKQAQLNGKKSEIDRLLTERKNVLDDYKALESHTETDTCFNCGQKLPDNKLAEAESKKQAALSAIGERGEKVKTAIDKVKQDIETLTTENTVLHLQRQTEHSALTAAESERTKRFAEIDEAIKSNPKPDPTKDKEWQQIVADIEKLEAEIGEPTGDQITALDNRRTILNNELAEVNKALADADNAKKAKARIIELGEQEKALAQQLADIERQLAMIGDYTQKESELIETSVNGMFKHVRFKMFETCLNGNIEPACEATFHGTPYGGLSTGETIFVGIDIINVLAKHYGISAPLFIDRSESFTMENEATCQTIQLKAVKGITKLTVEKE